MTNPHDNLFHYTFGKPRHAEGWLRSVLPEDIAAAVRWETLRQGPERIDGRDLRLRFADVVHFADLVSGATVVSCAALDEAKRATLIGTVHVHGLTVLRRMRSEALMGSRWRPGGRPA